MKYYMYPLKFQGPVHFGDVATGGNLERVIPTFSSDSFYSAICNELSGSQELERFQTLICKEQIKISSLFPYYFEDEWQCYLPKPVFYINNVSEPRSFNETKEQATILKRVKKVEYVRSSVLYNDEQKFDFETLMLDAETMPDFGCTQVVTRLNTRNDLGEPYYVGSFVFSVYSGLYGIVGFLNEEDKQFFDSVIELLSYSGLGGKRSSGYGKFELCQSPILISNLAVDEDIQALYGVLTNKSASKYMNISVLIPKENELSYVVEGQYTLRKRSGFILSPHLRSNIKRNSYYAIKEGGCFKVPLQGRIIDFKIPEISHVVKRNGLGFFVGVNYEP